MIDISLLYLVYLGHVVSQGDNNHTKIGMTGGLSNRKKSLDTSYSVHGMEFEYLILCDSEEEESKIEKHLHGHFWKDSTTHLEGHSGGLEWFQRRYQLEEIKEALFKGGFENKVISDPNEIKEILREHKKYYESEKENYMKEMKKLNEEINRSNISEQVTPSRDMREHFGNDRTILDLSDYMRDYQKDENIVKWFDINDKGILNWCCGLGKTLESLYISAKYMDGYLLIGVNNLALIEQWIDSIKRIYHNYPIICVSSETIRDILSTTNIGKINKWFQTNTVGIVITTYRSAHKLLEMSLTFSFSILDEVHHLCNSETVNEGHRNTDILKLNVNKRLGLTATMKEIDDDENENKIDNMNESIFGEIIDEKSVLWGIENGYICDYQLSVPRVTYQELEDILGECINKDSCYLYLSAYISLLTLSEGTCKKLLIFVNKIQDMEKLYEIIIKMLRSSIDSFHIDSENIFKTDMKTNEIVCKFNDIDIGILINCFKIGEGVDIPSLDGVLFADNMESTVRITQGALRGCRIDPNNKDKKATIIVPTIYEKEDDKSYDENDNIKGFDTLMHIIKELSISDENVIQKVVPTIIGEGNSPGGLTRSFYQDIDEEYKFKMRIITRGELGKKTFPSCKRIVQKMGGRKEDNITFYADYKKNKQCVNGLPDIEWMDKYLKRNDKSWIELYSFDISEFPTWSEFEKKYKKQFTSEEYEGLVKSNKRLPKAHDLEDIYGNSNYNRGFWDDSCYDDEF
jgi:superfamily II DNA or RNA helicase